MTTKDILLDFIGLWSNQNKIYSQQCTVKSVDAAKRICVCTPTDGSADILNVRLEADITVNSEDIPISSTSKGWFVVPKVGSIVGITFYTKNEAFISVWTEIDDIVVKSTNFTAEQTLFKFNDGSLGGLIKIVEQTTKLNKLVSETQAELAKIAIAITGVGGSYTPGTLTTFDKNDYEDTKVVH
jgi:hypothetical protein